MDDQAGIDCSGLITRTDFPQYLTALISVTGRDLSNVTHCKAIVCNALWGSGNPDISGIGVCIQTHHSSRFKSHPSLNIFTDDRWLHLRECLGLRSSLFPVAST